MKPPQDVLLIEKPIFKEFPNTLLILKNIKIQEKEKSYK